MNIKCLLYASYAEPAKHIVLYNLHKNSMRKIPQSFPIIQEKSEGQKVHDWPNTTQSVVRSGCKLRSVADFIPLPY